MTASLSTAKKRPRPTPQCVFRGHEDSVSALHFLRTISHASLVASGDQSGSVNVWDTSLEECILRLPSSNRGASSAIITITEDLSSTALFSHSKSGLVRQLDFSLSTETPAAPLGVVGDNVVCQFAESFCGICVVGPRLLAGPSEAAGSGLAVRDLRVESSIPEIQLSPTDTSRGMLMSIDSVGATSAPSCREVAAGYEDGSVAVWDMRATGAPVSSVARQSSEVTAVASCPMGGSVLAIGTATGNLSASRDGSVIACGVLRDEGIACIRWRSDCRLLATAGWDGRVRLWDGRRRKDSLLRPLASLSWHSGQALSLAFCEETRLLASGGADNTIALWSVYC